VPTSKRLATALAVAIALAALPGGGRGETGRPLAEQVEIRRDRFGVPHILAESDAAAAFGLGYAQAEDHGEALLRRFVAARGEAARHFGEESKDDDFLMKWADNEGEARRALALVGREYRKVIEAFAAGVNHYVRGHRSQLPAWAPELTAADLLASSRSGAVEALAAPALLRALRQKYPTPDARPASAERVTLTLDEDAPGSNALAIGPSRSASGKPILLGNPHLRWSSLYWEAHVTVPGRLNFYGSTLVGIPWLRAGFNDRLGYVQTNNAPDLADVYALPLDPGKPDHYLFERKSRPLARKDVSVLVLQADGTLRAETRSFWSSHLGPVVYRSADKAFAYRSVGLLAWRYFEGFYELSHARSLSEFRKLLGRQLIPTSNFTYADADGNVFYQWNARLPRRAGGPSYELDVPGGDGRYLWRGFHRLSELPSLLNPSHGYLQNANNSPWYPARRDTLDPRRYPSGVERRELSERAQLALTMLESRERFTPDDVRRLKFETRLLSAERLRPALVAAVDALEPPSEEQRSAAAVLRDWDARADAQSRGAVLFQRFVELYLRKAKQPWASPWDAARPFDTPSGLGEPGLAVEALAEAVRSTRAAHGSEAVAWGDVNRFRFGDLDLPGDGASGQLGAYRVLQFDAQPDGRRVAGWGPEAWRHLGFGDAWVLLVHFTRPVQAWSVLAYGQTSDRDSPHSRDQIRLFASHELRPVLFSEAEIEANLERRYRP
jgi:acyl-homoserine-lactone acylase